MPFRLGRGMYCAIRRPCGHVLLRYRAASGVLAGCRVWEYIALCLGFCVDHALCFAGGERFLRFRASHRVREAIGLGFARIDRRAPIHDPADHILLGPCACVKARICHRIWEARDDLPFSMHDDDCAASYRQIVKHAANVFRGSNRHACPCFVCMRPFARYSHAEVERFPAVLPVFFHLNAVEKPFQVVVDRLRRAVCRKQRRCVPDP